MAFVVVEYSESCGGGVSLVNKKWLTPRKQEVWWPPYKHQHLYDKALTSGDAPDETWSLYSISRTFYETDDYIKARKKLELSRLQSDLQSEAEDESVPHKRKRRPRILSFGSDDDESTTEEVTESFSKQKKLPRPPKIRLGAPTSQGKRIIAKCIDDSNQESFTPIFEGQNSSSLRNIVESQESINEKASSSCSSCLGDSGVQEYSRQLTPSTSVSPLKSTASTEAVKNSDFNKKILSLMVYLKEQNSQILKLLETFQKPSVIHPFELPDNLPATFPLNNIEDIQKVEQFLDSKENFNALASYYSTIGGRDTVSKTNTILKNLVTNALASQYSFLGTRNGKRAFSHLKLKLVVVRAVQMSCPDSLENDICNNIKTWLKHAPQRTLKDNQNHRQH